MIFEKNRGWSRKQRDTVLVVVLVLAIGNGVQAYQGIANRQRNARIDQVLISQGRQEIATAVEGVQQLSRTGGSYTISQMGVIRQHLYAIRQLNAIAAALYGVNRGLVDNAKVDQSMDQLSAMEARLLAGQTIDVQLSNLRALLEGMSADIASLSPD